MPDLHIELQRAREGNAIEIAHPRDRAVAVVVLRRMTIAARLGVERRGERLVR